MNLDSKSALTRLLRKHDIVYCKGVKWAHGKTAREAWNTCHRADWMLEIARKSGLWPESQWRIAACKCARRALKYVPAGENRPRLAILAAERYARKPSAENLERMVVAWIAAGDAARAAEWVAERNAAWAAAAAASGDARGAAAWAVVAGVAARYLADIVRECLRLEDL